jgi:RNA polymerase sigma-70 factor (ECF subfamily)
MRCNRRGPSPVPKHHAQPGRETAIDATDAELIVASHQDPYAFVALYDRWVERLLAFFYRRVYDAEIAADLTAETFAIAYERRDRFRDTGKPGSAWLFGIARKELQTFFRRQRAETKAVRRLGITVPPMDDESIARIEALADLPSQQAALADALDRISGRERDAVQLRVLKNLDYPTIAERLGCSEGAARVRVHRGLARLASILEVSS